MLLSISFMIVFGARTATVDWGQMYLIEEKNQSQYVGMWYICLFLVDLKAKHFQTIIVHLHYVI